MELIRLIKKCLSEAYSKVSIGEYLSHKFPIQYDLKHGVALSLLLYNFGLEFAIRKVQVYQMGLKLNGTHQLIVYADDANNLGDNIGTIKKDAETLSKHRETKYRLLIGHQNATKNHDIKIADRSFENMAQIKYSETTVTNQN
jgi:hypothetical protein